MKRPFAPNPANQKICGWIFRKLQLGYAGIHLEAQPALGLKTVLDFLETVQKFRQILRMHFCA